MLLASPDFGAGGAALLCGCFAVLAVAAATLLGLVAGARRVAGRPPGRRRLGWCLIAASLLLPLGCWRGPGLLFRAYYGRGPLDFYAGRIVREGMTPDEVRRLLGEPHDIMHPGNGESWIYWRDATMLDYFGVSFGPDGRVKSTYS